MNLSSMDWPKNILNLPSELLMEIIKYVPNKTVLKLTSKKFFQIVCKIEIKKFRLVIKDVSKRNKRWQYC